MSRAGFRVDLYRSEREDLYRSVRDGYWRREWRWRLLSSSSVVGQSSEGYVKRSAALHNLETVLCGRFEKTSTPDRPEPYGVLIRGHWDWVSEAVDPERIPVRLKVGKP